MPHSFSIAALAEEALATGITTREELAYHLEHRIMVDHRYLLRRRNAGRHTATDDVLEEAMRYTALAVCVLRGEQALPSQKEKSPLPTPPPLPSP